MASLSRPCSTIPCGLAYLETWTWQISGVEQVQSKLQHCCVASRRSFLIGAEIQPWIFVELDGFCQAVGLAMRLKPGGCLAMGPTCSSFGYGPTSTTGRKASNFAGDLDNELVQMGDFEAEVAGFFLFLAVARGVHAWIEQPAGSMLFSYLEGALHLLPFLVAACTPRCFYSREPLGERFFKKYKFLATGRWILNIVEQCPCNDLGHKLLMTVSPTGKKTGIKKNMVASQVYPRALGEALVSAWRHAHLLPATKSWSPGVQRQGRLSSPWGASAADEAEVQVPRLQLLGPALEQAGPWDGADWRCSKRRSKRCKGNQGLSSTGPWEEPTIQHEDLKGDQGQDQGLVAAMAGPWDQYNLEEDEDQDQDENKDLNVDSAEPGHGSSSVLSGPWA